MNSTDIRRVDLSGKRVLMRVDFNVEFSGGKPRDVHKIASVKSTIDLLMDQPGIKIALLSHLGRPSEKEAEFSFKGVFKEIGKILGRDLVFVPDSRGPDVQMALDSMKPGQILMLENVRFHKDDEGNFPDFSQELATGFDVFVNDAFGVAHRAHSSTTGIIDILPSYLGINFTKEIEELSKTRSGFKKPAVAIIGGAKIETKIPVIDFFAKNYDCVLVGGKMGIEAEKMKIIFPKNVIIPEDYEGAGKDIGQKTIRTFKKMISTAGTIIWNGPLGLFEMPPYDRGTSEVLFAIIQNKNADRVAGGGETVEVLEEKNLLNEFHFVSTGGGAMLEFLAKGTLPVIEAFLKVKK